MCEGDPSHVREPENHFQSSEKSMALKKDMLTHAGGELQ